MKSSGDKHSRENQLLIAAARHLLNSGRHDKLESLISSPLDWDYVLETSGRHGLAPLLFKTLQDANVHETVPEKYMDALRRSYLTSLMNNQRLYGTLKSVLENFNAHEVPVILLKGAALGLTIYEDMALRPFGDLDILVPRHQVALCRSMLEEMGFSLIKGIYFPIPDERNEELGCEWSYHLDNAVVELHWDLINKRHYGRLGRLDIDVSLFWKDVVEIDADGQRAFVFTPENQLIHLCMHQFFKHHWEHVRDLTDIALVLEKTRDEFDWDRACHDALSQGLGPCLYYNLSLTSQILRVDPPPSRYMRELLGRAKPGRITVGVLDLISENIFAKHLPRSLWEFTLTTGIRNRIALVLINVISNPLFGVHGGQAEGNDSSASIFVKIRAVFKSLFFYRNIFVDFLRYLRRS